MVYFRVNLEKYSPMFLDNAEESLQELRRFHPSGLLWRMMMIARGVVFV